MKIPLGAHFKYKGNTWIVERIRPVLTKTQEWLYLDCKELATGKKDLFEQTFILASGWWLPGFDGSAQNETLRANEDDSSLPKGYPVYGEEIKRKRKEEGRCVSCGELLAMSAFGLLPCPVCYPEPKANWGTQDKK